MVTDEGIVVPRIYFFDFCVRFCEDLLTSFVFVLAWVCFTKLSYILLELKIDIGGCMHTGETRE